jgi:hypothetical protein
VPGAGALCRLLGLGLVLSLAGATGAAAAAVPHFQLQLSTDRGCRETGQDPVYVVGEPITISFRVGSAVVANAKTALFVFLPNFFAKAISFGNIAVNQTRFITGRAGLPIGIHRLILDADAVGVRRTQRACSFRVVPAGTPAATRTPTMTPTPTSTVPSPTPGALHARITTNRGCLEDGDDASFAAGGTIVVSFRVNSMTKTFASVSIRDTLPNGLVKIFSFGSLPTNAGFQFGARVGSTTGVETLQLRARAAGVPDGVDTCSFRVVHFPFHPTRTRTPTPTPTPTP